MNDRTLPAPDLERNWYRRKRPEGWHQLEHRHLRRIGWKPLHLWMRLCRLQRGMVGESVTLAKISAEASKDGTSRAQGHRAMNKLHRLGLLSHAERYMTSLWPSRSVTAFVCRGDWRYRKEVLEVWVPSCVFSKLRGNENSST